MNPMPRHRTTQKRKVSLRVILHTSFPTHLFYLLVKRSRKLKIKESIYNSQTWLNTNVQSQPIVFIKYITVVYLRRGAWIKTEQVWNAQRSVMRGFVKSRKGPKHKLSITWNNSRGLPTELKRYSHNAISVFLAQWATVWRYSGKLPRNVITVGRSGSGIGSDAVASSSRTYRCKRKKMPWCTRLRGSMFHRTGQFPYTPMEIPMTLKLNNFTNKANLVQHEF